MSKDKKKHKEPDMPAEAAPAPEAEPVGAKAPEPAEDAMQDRLLRLQADFDNFRKRTARERAELQVHAREQLFAELLPVLDHFELGLATAVEHKVDKAVHDGFQMVYDQLIQAVERFGLKPIDVHEGHFDPHLHEAISYVPSDEYAADEIVQQTRRGYKLGDRLLRPVQVVVSSGPGAPRDDEVKSGAEVEGSSPGAD